ncbi:MAG: helix-turn-helix domain-containing protein [Pseudonocardiaceae bacterium]
MNPPRQPDPDWWDEPQMHRALADRDISTVYRLLCAAGLSQTQIGNLTGQSQSEVSEILNGRQVIFYAVLERIADGLGIPRGHMGLAYTDADGNLETYCEEGGGDEEDDEMIKRRVLGAVSAALLGETVLNGPIMQLGTTLLGEPGGLRLLTGPSGKLTKTDVIWIKNATEKFRAYDHQYGGASIYGAVRGMAEQVVGALHGSEPADWERRELYSSVSGLCRVAAWAAFDAGHNREFWRCHATALDLASRAGHTDLVVTTVRDAARAEILSGNHRDAAKLLELMTVKRAPDAVNWGLLGSAYAPHSPQSTRTALEHLHDAEGADTADAIAMGGHLNLDLGDYSAAIAAYQRALPKRAGRTAIQETAPLAMAHLQAGETAVGVQYAQQALDLNGKVRSSVATKGLGGLGTILAAQNDSTAQDLAQRVRQLAAAPVA